MNIIINKSVKAILRPPKLLYDIKKIPIINNIPGFGDIIRISFSFLNFKKQRLYGSFYQSPNPIKENPCVIYFHGNASNQLEGRFCVSLFLPLGINVFCFDFGGCGCSEGEFVSLGYFESIDSEILLNILKNDFKCNIFGLWGRSMGSVTSLFLLKNNNFNIVGAIIDSPFSSLIELCKEFAKDLPISNISIDLLISKIKEKILIDANFNIEDVNILKFSNQIKLPIFFIHSIDDTFISFNHSEKIFNSIQSELKILKLINGEHNEDRPLKIIYEATEFLCQLFGINISFDLPSENENIQQNSLNQHMKNINDFF